MLTVIVIGPNVPTPDGVPEIVKPESVSQDGSPETPIEGAGLPMVVTV